MIFYDNENDLAHVIYDFMSGKTRKKEKFSAKPIYLQYHPTDSQKIIKIHFAEAIPKWMKNYAGSSKYSVFEIEGDQSAFALKHMNERFNTNPLFKGIIHEWFSNMHESMTEFRDELLNNAEIVKKNLIYREKDFSQLDIRYRLEEIEKEKGALYYGKWYSSVPFQEMDKEKQKEWRNLISELTTNFEPYEAVSDAVDKNIEADNILIQEEDNSLVVADDIVIQVEEELLVVADDIVIQVEEELLVAADDIVIQVEEKLLVAADDIVIQVEEELLVVADDIVIQVEEEPLIQVDDIVVQVEEKSPVKVDGNDIHVEAAKPLVTEGDIAIDYNVIEPSLGIGLLFDDIDFADSEDSITVTRNKKQSIVEGQFLLF